MAGSSKPGPGIFLTDHLKPKSALLGPTSLDVKGPLPIAHDRFGRTVR